ncbi:hypothetical protein [Streptomyces sp. Z26]|uniref:hypothetical protein n=1 Tax=Streptomyces sp. Z26 TaxID=2500177 RepID=UPI000EF15C93|nr:hypothetical protein [Streptomyces sp. Z26]RLL68145.1 hypothetical protein D7M15_16320 [Streptomyces sp. Z26]
MTCAPYPNVEKARAQVARGDTEHVRVYSAQLQYRHVPQRFILSTNATYGVIDEVHLMRVQDTVNHMLARMGDVQHAYGHPHAHPTP